MLKKQLQTFLAGMVTVAPFALTIYVIWSAGMWLGAMGSGVLRGLLHKDTADLTPIISLGGVDVSPFVGAILVLGAVYIVGLLTRLWAFDWVLGGAERLVEQVPGVKTIYESVRDLLKLFGGASKGMGKAVLYKPPGTSLALLGIMTNEHPGGTAHEGGRVAIYLPMAYMVGGPIIYVPRQHVEMLDMSVEQALKLCATAEISSKSLPK